MDGQKLFSYLVIHKFTPIVSQSGQVFLGANNPEVLKHFKGGWIRPTKSSLFQKEEIQHYREQLSTEEASSLCWKKGIRFVAENPLFTTKLIFYKFKLFWHLHRDISIPSLQYFFVFLFAIYGSIISLKILNAVLILYLLPLFFSLCR